MRLFIGIRFVGDTRVEYLIAISLIFKTKLDECVYKNTASSKGRTFAPVTKEVTYRYEIDKFRRKFLCK